MGFIFRGIKAGRKPVPFDQRYEKIGECFVWKNFSSQDYPRVRFNGAIRKAHHVAYELANGPLPKSAPGNAEFVVMHLCDNRLCVNPSHLRLGTVRENIDDRQNKCRQARGEKHSRAILTEQDVLRIKEAHLFGGRIRDLSAIYGVSRRAVTSILTGVNWRHVWG